MGLTKAITPKQRVLRAIRRQPLDYFPSHVDFTPEASRQTACSLGISEEDLDDVFENHFAASFSLGSVEEYLQNPLILEMALDFGLARLDGDIVTDAWGVGWDRKPDGGWPSVYPLQDLSAYKTYQFPDPDDPHLMDLVQTTASRFGDERFVLALHHTALFERAWSLRGFENALLDFRQHPQFVEDLYERITEYQISLAKRFIAAGIDGAMVGDDYGMQHGLLMNPATWRKMIKPCLQRIWRVYQDAGLPVIQHSCGDVRPLLPDFVEMKLDVLHPVQPLAMPSQEIQSSYGETLVFFGGLDTQHLLPFGTPEDVFQAVRQSIEVLGSNGAYIFAPAQAVMPDVPVANVRALIEGIKEFR